MTNNILTSNAQTTSRVKPPRLYLVYILLALFDILTVSISLYLNHSIMSIYTNSVEVNREWATRLGRLADLRELAGAVNAPGNDVFDSRNLVEESAIMTAALQQFRDMLATIRMDLDRHVKDKEKGPLLQNLITVQGAVEEMVGEATLIFSYFKNQQPDEAGKHMATMDRKYAQVHAAFSRLTGLIRAIQQTQFDQQREAAVSMQKFEFLIAMFIILMVSAASMYGHWIYRRMLTDTRDKERFLEALQEKEERYRLLVEGVKDHANIMLDPQGTVASWNAGAERLNGYRADAILGQHFSFLYENIEGDGRGRFNTHLRESETEDRIEIQSWQRRKDGSRFWAEVGITALRDEMGQLRGYSQITRDITERKVADEALRKAHAELEDRVEKRTAELSQANHTLQQEILERKRAEEEKERLISQLEAKNVELEEYAYTVSHDFKTPLVTIRGFLGMLEKDVAQGNIVQMKQDMNHIYEATTKLQRLLDELLELSRVGRIINPPQEVEIGDLVSEARALVAGLIKQRGVTVDIPSRLPVLFGDRPRLVEVMQNLIDNAVKFMGDQRQPRIEIGVKEIEGEQVCYVRDNGIGIDPRYHQKVFGLFERLDSKTPGTGIGLALVKRIVEVHGWRTWVESNGTGKGATFCFSFSSRGNRYAHVS